MTGKERLEKIKKVHLERIKQDEFYTASFIHVEWLIEQAEKVETLENKIAVLLDEFSHYDYAEIAYQLSKMINK